MSDVLKSRIDNIEELIEGFNDDIASLRVEDKHLSGNIKAIDAGYAAVTKAIIDNCANILKEVERQSDRILMLETKNSQREGRDSFISALFDKWPLIVLIVGGFFYVEHGSVSFKNPLDKPSVQSAIDQQGNQ